MTEPVARRAADDLSLAELVNRVLDRGALVTGEVVISVAGVDLVYLGLQLLLSSVESMEERAEPAPRARPGPGADGDGGVPR